MGRTSGACNRKNVCGPEDATRASLEPDSCRRREERFIGFRGMRKTVVPCQSCCINRSVEEDIGGSGKRGRAEAEFRKSLAARGCGSRAVRGFPSAHLHARAGPTINVLSSHVMADVGAIISVHAQFLQNVGPNIEHDLDPTNREWQKCSSQHTHQRLAVFVKAVQMD